MGPEDRVVKQVKAEIIGRGGYCRKIPGSGLSSGWPDVIGCIGGRLIMVECKAPGKAISGVRAVQRTQLKRWANVGAISMIIDDVEVLREELDRRL